MREPVDPAAPDEVAALPIAPARLVEMRADEGAIVRDIAAAVGVGEKAAKAGVIGKPLDRHAFQIVEGNMRGVEVDRDDLRRVGRQIGEDVAAPARDRRDPVARRDCQRLHVDHRIFPDLGIDETLERQRKSAVEQALFLFAIFTNDVGGDLAIGLAGHANGFPGQC